jgi:hypothetical protein
MTAPNRQKGNAYVKAGVIAMCALVASVAVRSAEFHVAVNGRDNQPGTAEKPFATLTTARDAARKAGEGPHTIQVHAGDYFVSEPLVLTAQDSGLTIVGDDRSKVRLIGGKQVTGWQRDGETFWQVALPGVKEGEWDFRALIVNGRLATRATFPNTKDTLENLGKWDLPLLPMLAGFWARKPTHEELTVMPYKPGDIPEDLDVRNAEVRLYHMWAESLVGVASHDKEKHELVMSSPAAWPMGACKRRKYVIYNTREGMKEPGQWYLDRTNGRLVYWPLPDEDMTKADVIAPVMNRVLELKGSRKAPVTNVTLKNLTVQCTSTELKSPGWGSASLTAAVELNGTKDCVLDSLTTSNVGGLGVAVTNSSGGVLRNSEVAQTGACGVKINAKGMRVEKNHIHHTGVSYPGSAGVIMSADGIELVRNEIHDTPYSGVIGGGGKKCLIEENLIYRAMLVMHDGAAIYGNLKESVIRGNVVRDIRPNGKGFGASGYYLDEGSYDCIIEKNVSLNVARPTHNHITRGTIIRDNVFVFDGDMTVSFQRSENITFSGNTLHVGGRLRTSFRNAVKTWENNRIFRADGKDSFVIDGWVPLDPPEKPKRQGVVAKPMATPTLDAKVEADEWPVPTVTLDRDSSSFVPGGPPTLAQVGYDKQNLYVSLRVNRFRGTTITDGAGWGKDDGAEIHIQGQRPDGTKAMFRIRSFAGGALQCTADTQPADALQKQAHFTGKISKTRWGASTGWKGEWQIPLAVLGITPKPGSTIPFNIRVYITETKEHRGWEADMGKLVFSEK